MNIRAITIETGKRAKPLRTCVGCGCFITAPRRCGPCAHDKREADRRRRLAERKARHIETTV